MARPQHQPHLTAADYLAWEATQAERHEYLDGEVFAMAGAEDRHVTVSGNLYMALRNHLRGSPCKTYMSDMRLHVAASNAYFYPDVLVTCDAGDHASRLSKSEPTLIAEVLSSSTGSYDRGAKFAHYRHIARLAEYVLVDIERRATDVYRKGEDGLWVLHPFTGDQAVQLASVALQLPASELFADLEPEPARD
ncbi:MULTISPECIES: Uma2 family endonuclease [unclassified Acidovorax]|uniref:Uma2 family endonuclease n=1 Tax=unclassified Acidovorax TaxID=2684926 RepID=UPI0028832734|nr:MULTISPECIES: Uma2 family endonuclease [unclassified Acidovorax]